MNQIALVILKHQNLQLVSLIEQLEYEPSVHLKSPHSVSGKTKLVLTPWPENTKDEHVLFNSDALLTICEPSDKLIDAYMKKLGITEEDLKAAPRPVILNEDEQVPTFEDEYEPQYAEEA